MSEYTILSKGKMYMARLSELLSYYTTLGLVLSIFVAPIAPFIDFVIAHTMA